MSYGQVDLGSFIVLDSLGSVLDQRLTPEWQKNGFESRIGAIFHSHSHHVGAAIRIFIIENMRLTFPARTHIHLLNTLQNGHLSLSSLALGIIRIEKGPVGSVSG